MNMNKFAILRMKIEGRILRHLAGIVLFSTFVISDFWDEKCEILVEILEEFLEEWIHIDYSISEDIAVVILIYIIVLSCEHFIKFAVHYLTNLFKKKTEVSE